MNMDFSGKHVLVVGGSSGIGLAAARGFHDAGASVSVTGTRASASDYDGLDDLAYAQLDTADRHGVAAFAATVRALDVLVNAAGMVMYGRKEFDIANFEAVLAANLTGIFQLCAALRPALAAAKGAIVNIGSVASHRGVIGQPAYSASKGGMLTLTKSLALAYAKDGIRVNQVSPGLVQTKLTRVSWEADDRRHAIERGIPLGRIGRPRDIAGAILFLASDLAGWTTGTDIIIDGGASA
ncbi:MAG: SDR family oxidoreductase [Pseudomonadota bacterium]